MVGWQPSDISFDDLIYDETDHPVATVLVTTPAGAIKVMAELYEEIGKRRVLRLIKTHIQTEIPPNAVGIVALRSIARAALEVLEYDEIYIEGAPRTTGANPGRRPRVLRFAQ